MKKYEIHTIDLNFQGAAQSIAAYIVSTELGPVVIETGPHSTFDVLSEAIGDFGYSVKDVKHVFLTHIHLDHAGSAWCFAKHGAKVYVHPFGYRHMADPSKLLHSAQRIYGDEMDTLWGSLNPISEELLIEVSHQQVIDTGVIKLTGHHTPGHAKHHIAWQLEENLFTGDVAGVCINDGPVIPPCPPPDINREHWTSSIDYLMALKEIECYYLGHYGKVNNPQEHMIKLKKTLQLYFDFLEPYARKEMEIGKVIPFFKDFVNDLYQQQGVSTADIQAYERANPSEMSVYGIFRYWKKAFESRNI